MRHYFRKNLSLILGIAIPLVMILLVAASICLPSLFIQPKTNFIYATDDVYCRNQQQYGVQNGKVIQNTITAVKDCALSLNQSKLYFYDTAKNQPKIITFVEAQNFTLDPDRTSPDKFTVVYGTHDGGFFTFFFGPMTDYSAVYLTGRGVSKKLNIPLDESQYNNNFHFLGWLK